MLFFAALWLSTLLKFCGVAIAVAGVLMFGFHFIRENARSARRGESSVPSIAWRGEGPKKGARIIAAGALALTASLLVSLILPAMP